MAEVLPPPQAPLGGDMPSEKTAILLTPAITALLSTSVLPPVTVVDAATIAPVTTAQSIPPDQLPVGTILSDITASAAQEEDLVLEMNGTKMSDIAIVYMDKDGNEAFLPASKIAEFLDGEAMPTGYVLSGKIKLYGVIPARLYLNEGTAVSNITWIEEYVKIADKLSLGSLIPSLADNEDLNAIQLENLQLSYVSALTINTTPGVWLETDVIFTGPLQPVSDVLRNVFGQSRPALHMKAMMSNYCDWTHVPRPPGLNLWGILENTSVKLGDLEIVRLGVQVTAERVLVYSPNPKMTWKFGWGFTGTALMNLPGSVTPLEMSLLVRNASGYLTFDLDVVGDKPWEDALGIPGFDISDFQMSARVPTTKANMKSISFGLSAMMNFGGRPFSMTGYYSSAETKLNAYLSGFTLSELIESVENLFDIDLEVPDFEVEFRDLQFELSSVTGLVLAGVIIVDGYQSTAGRIAISRAGIEITGAINNVEIGEVTITGAAIHVTIPLSASKTTDPNALVRPLPASFSIGGTVKFADLEISAGLYFAKPAANSAAGPGVKAEKNWIVYGELKEKNGMKASELLPALQGSFLNFSLRNIVFLASNVDAIAPAGFLNSFNYPITRGVQLFAAFNSIDEIDSLTRSQNPALTLKAGYSSGIMSLDIIMPNENTVMVMKNSNLRPKPFTIGIRVSKQGPSLALKSGFDVIVPNQLDPLSFNFGLNADIKGANGFGEMLGYWKNPLGISDQLEIGDLALQMGIIYAVFFSTGTPSTFAITGGIKFGKTKANVALSVSEDPGQLLISGSVQNLDFTDIMDLARKVTNLTLPDPDADFLMIEDMTMYMSSGVTVGTRYFPPGFSASGALRAFGKRATMACSMSTSGVLIKGSLDAFELGPLTVRGRRGQNLVMDIEMSAGTHKILLDGEATLGPLLAGIYLNFLQQGAGDLVLEFDAEMAFSDLFRMTAKGKAKGGVKGIAAQRGLKGVEFDVRAEMKQEIVNYVMAQVNAQFIAAQYAATQSFNEARAALDKAEKAFNEGVEAAQKDLDNARKRWEDKSKAVNKVFDDAKAAQTARINELKEDVRRKKGDFDAAVDRANRKLETAQNTAASEIGKARSTVERKKGDVDREISSKQRILSDAEQDMNRRFGNALKDIQNAQNDMNNKLRDLNAITSRMNAKQREIDRAGFFNKIKLGFEMTPIAVEYAAKKSAFEIANGVLKAAEAIVQGPGYKLAEGTMLAARGSLEAAKITGKAAIDGATSTMNGVIIAQNAVVDTAQQGLEFTKTAGDELKLWKLAEAALDTYLRESNKVVSGFQSAVDELSKTAEYIAFTTADGALKIAKANFGDMDILRKGVDFAEKSASTGLKVAAWAAKALGNMFDIEQIIMTAQLGSLAQNGKFSARILGDVANKRVDFNIEFTVGDAKEFVKGIFEKLWDEIEAGILSIDL